MLDLEIPESRDIGGISALIIDGAIAHWNTDIPGIWVGPHALTKLGSYVSKYCKSKPGIYRLIGLDDAGSPAEFERMCGRDKTGTLYIGREGKTFSDRSRLTKLVRSLRKPRNHIYNDEHRAGYRLRKHPILSERFPPASLALTWCYSSSPADAEKALLGVYFSSFGDTPPLNLLGSFG